MKKETKKKEKQKKKQTDLVTWKKRNRRGPTARIADSKVANNNWRFTLRTGKKEESGKEDGRREINNEGNQSRAEAADGNRTKYSRPWGMYRAAAVLAAYY